MWAHKITYIALMVLSLFLFTFFAICPAFHILISISGVYFTYHSIKNKTFLQTSWEKALAILIAIMILSILINYPIVKHPFKNLFKIKYFLITLISIPALKETFKNYIDDRKLKILVTSFIGSVTFASTIGLLSYITQYDITHFKAANITRSSGMYGMVMSYAYGLSMILPVMIAGLINYKKISKFINLKFLIFAIVVNVVGLYFSYTRGALLGFIIALPFCFMFTHKKIFAGLMIASIALTAVATYITLFNVDTKFYRLNAKRSNSVRQGLYKVTMSMVKEHPVLGVGFRNYESQVKSYRTKYKLNDSTFTGHAHNNFMEFLGGTGILGLIVYIALLFLWLKELFKNRIWPGRLVLPFAISFLVSGMFQSTIIDGENTFLIMAIMALCQVTYFKGASHIKWMKVSY